MSISANRAAVDQTPQTRERILDSAERLFAERGFGASIRDITSAAGANIAAVNYYFRSKDELYREAMLRLMRIHRERRLQVIRSVMSNPKARVEELLSAFADAVVQVEGDGETGRILMRLMHREITEPHLPPEMGFNEVMRPVEAALVEALTRLEPGLDAQDARWCVQSFVAQLLWANQVATLFFDPEHRDKAPFSVEQMVAHIVRFTASGIRVAAQSSSPAA
jgi:AcrR family transcriptional regulator